MRIQRPSRTGAWIAALALAAVLPACGGGSSGGGNAPTTLPPAPQPTRTQVDTFSFNLAGTVEALRQGYERDEAHRPLTLSQAGSVEIIADWTFASNDVDILLYSGTCTFQLVTTVGCTVVSRTTSTTTKPERLTVNATAGTFTIGITNYGPTNESGVVQVFVTR